MPPPARRWERCRSSGRPRPSRQGTTTTDSFFLPASWMDVLDSSYWGDIYWWAGFVPRHGEYDQLSFEPPKLDLALHTSKNAAKRTSEAVHHAVLPHFCAAVVNHLDILCLLPPRSLPRHLLVKISL